ncbi:MAG: hypothetical protein KDD47_19700, partial [Acidobacteria bacterium]|nr:hypothetical protein [Acidobacteriota bacterium]
GTHFFHNLTSQRVGYFTVDLGNSEHLADLEFLERQNGEQTSGSVRHVVLENPLEVQIDGRIRQGMVFLGQAPSGD